MDVHNQSWIGCSLSIASSTDPTLTGRQGIVVNETRNTIALLESDQHLVLNKASISFTVDNSDVVIQGALVGQRPEDRIHRTYRKA